MMSTVDQHDLYGLPFDRFTPERTALAKELRGAGDRDQADAVSKLRKPSLAAWAVNQLVRTQSHAVAELWTAGDAVQRAQSDLLSGRSESEDLREALRRERQAVRDLVERARGLLNSEGHELSPATLERVSETLDAAALDQEARAAVSDGCLNRELRHVGLGALAPTDAQSKTRGARASRQTSQTARVPAVDRRALRQREAEARRAAERTARELKAAQSKRDGAAEALDAAESALDTARQRAEQAEAAHQSLQDQLRR
jgi:hypothetical protein